MSVSGGPNIVEDGLVLLLDVGNSRSYVSGSLTWYDISGNNKHFTLGTNIRYSTDNGGGLITSGGRMDCADAITTVTTGSVYMWSRTLDSGSGVLFMRSGSFASGFVGAWQNEGTFYGSVGTSYTIDTVPATRIQANNRYFMLEASSINFSSWTDGMRIANYPGLEYTSTIAVFAVYNRNLTQTERLQNFNAQRSRFGV